MRDLELYHMRKGATARHLNTVNMQCGCDGRRSQQGASAGGRTHLWSLLHQCADAASLNCSRETSQLHGAHRCPKEASHDEPAYHNPPLEEGSTQSSWTCVYA